MDLSFDLYNRKGDHVLVALSSYDQSVISSITDDINMPDVCFYDVSLIRKGGKGMVGYKILMRIANILGDFLKENSKVVLCFYCDGATDIERHHKDIPPQLYRSLLFSKMFDMYIRKYGVSGIVNYPLAIVADDPYDSQYAHFICREDHLHMINHLGEILTRK